MKRTEFWRWLITDERTGKRRALRYHLTEADALARDPAAERVPGSLDVRMLPETDAEQDLLRTSGRRAG